MKLPNLEHAVVPEAKVTEYLLSLGHPVGGPKAAFFARFGFSVEAWDVLAAALLRHVADHDVAATRPTAFGTRYVVEGPLETPDGRDPRIRSVWFVRRGASAPRLVTAYPVSARRAR